MFYLKDMSPEGTARFQGALDQMSGCFTNGFVADNLIAFDRNLAFMNDARFRQAFEGSTQDEEQHLIWRRHVMCWFALLASRFDGDFVECGVFRGHGMKVVCDFLDINALGKRVLLFDTFSGLPEETSTQAERDLWNTHYTDPRFAGLYEEVCANFARYPNVSVIRGMVPQSFEGNLPERIAFVHLDMNSMQAEMLALEGLWDRIVPGGVILLDDYGWLVNREQMQAEQAFFAERGIYVLELPTGQGVVMK